MEEISLETHAQNDPPFLLAAIAGDTKRAAFLLEHGADIDGTDANGMTPLHAAAAHGQVAMVDWLLDHGATKNPYSPAAGLPLHLAAREGHDQAVRLLLYRGADIRNPDPTARTRDGESVLDVALARGYRPLVEWLTQLLAGNNV